VTEALDLLRGPVAKAAPRLLGWRLRSELDGEVTEVELTEVEAYGGPTDPASHAYRGPTSRNASMFAEAGTLYVYRSYGIHWCLNVVTGPPGDGSAVLLRGGRPTAGTDVMERRRGRSDHLTDGPGKLAQALGVNGAQDGADLLGSGPVCLVPATEGVSFEATPRIGISRATGRKWRFVVRR
jgi:DNA-3-methyladenine glycosylase